MNVTKCELAKGWSSGWSGRSSDDLSKYLSRWEGNAGCQDGLTGSILLPRHLQPRDQNYLPLATHSEYLFLTSFLTTLREYPRRKNKNDYGKIRSGNKSPSQAKLSSTFPYLFYFPAAAFMLTSSSSSTSMTSTKKQFSYFDQSEAMKFVTPQAGKLTATY